MIVKQRGTGGGCLLSPHRHVTNDIESLVVVNVWYNTSLPLNTHITGARGHIRATPVIQN